MVTVNSSNEFLDNNDGLTERLQNDTNSSTSFKNVGYSPQLNRKSFMKKIPNKVIKNFENTVDLKTNKQSSLCSSKHKISYKKSQSLDRLSSSHSSFNSSPIDEDIRTNSFQLNQRPSISVSSSQYASSGDYSYNNQFINVLRNPSVVQKYRYSYFDSRSPTDSQKANFESFFPASSTTADSFFDNLESREERKPSLEIHSKYSSEHRFHWSENIEYGSPWVRHRAKEIFNYVNGLNEMQKKSGSLEDDTEEVPQDLKSEVVREDCSETDDNITYEIASKLFDTFLKHHETNKSKNQCANDEHFKWSKLYQKLINYGQL